MKRFSTLIILSLVCFNLTYGKQVDEMTARTVGQNFFAKRIDSKTLKRISGLELVYTAQSDNRNNSGSGAGGTCFYVFNVNSAQGFIIVSAEDNVAPVLAYSDESGFNVNNIAPDVSWWLNGYKEQIEEVRAKNMQATDEIKSRWESLKTGTGSYMLYRSVKTVNPLEQTTWDQLPNYNAMCPYDNSANQRTVTGCVATGMAQILRYWNAPANGAGFHSYTDPRYGIQSANFGNTTYDWSNMPLSVTGANTAVATLMYHCGVSVGMTYGIAATGGSSAYVVSSQSPVQACAEYALKTYFGYPNAVGKVRSDYPNKTDWQSLLKTELDGGRPVLYAGLGSGGGHCFNCDGYDANDFFHFNWGWSGQFDGYFDIDALNPAGTGTGGGTGGFNSGQQCIIGIQGPNGTGSQSSTLDLYDFVTATPSDIEYGDAFTVQTNIANYTTTNFNGYLYAAIFDANNTFVDYVQALSGISIPAGGHLNGGVTFSNTGLLTMLPGNYSIGIFYSVNNDSLWIKVSDTNGYTNQASIRVHHANTLELYSDMVLTPGSTLVQGEAASVHLDVTNTGATAFTGIYDVSLYDLDGYAVATIGELTGQSLAAGGHTNGLDFNTTNLNCDPGTYFLAMQYLPDGIGPSWELTGSTNYPNPVEVTVQQAPYGADPWESNNNIQTASNLSVTFTGNTATINTLNANIANSPTTDYDYYKLVLLPGYSYTVGAMLYDLLNPGGTGPTYTVDAICSVSTDMGTTFTNTFDGPMANSVVSPSGGTIYFLVSPKFTGKTGTYDLSLNLIRNPLGINDLTPEAINIYPNPAKDVLMIDLTAFNGNFNQVRIMNTQGQQVVTVNPNGDQTFSVKVDNLPEGIYFVQLQTENGVYSKKFIITK
ncbi:MAG: thiol protease/hemagglutinin PrtT [Bacteroidetes bacterium]|nr:thiol protease/hemagglutinin PrtT [Bacteroidota bacterium]